MATGSRVLSAWGAHSLLLLLPSPPSLHCTLKAAFPGPGASGTPRPLLSSAIIPFVIIPQRPGGEQEQLHPPGPAGSCQSMALLLCSWGHGWICVLLQQPSRMSTPCCTPNPACEQPPSQPGPIQSQQLKLENRKPSGKGLASGTKSPSWHPEGCGVAWCGTVAAAQPPQCHTWPPQQNPGTCCHLLRQLCP